MLHQRVMIHFGFLQSLRFYQPRVDSTETTHSTCRECVQPMRGVTEEQVQGSNDEHECGEPPRDPLRLIVRWRRTDRRIIGHARSPHGIRHRPSLVSRRRGWCSSSLLTTRTSRQSANATSGKDGLVPRPGSRSRCSSHGGPCVPGRSGVRATSQLRQDGSRRTRAVGRTIGVMDGRTSLSVVLPSGASPCPSSISCSSTRTSPPVFSPPTRRGTAVGTDPISPSTARPMPNRQCNPWGARHHRRTGGSDHQLCIR